MKRTPADTKFIFVTLMLVLLLGVQTFRSLTEEDAVPVAREKVAANEGARRGPASVPPTALAMSKPATPLLDLDLSCRQDKAAAFKITGDFVQFKGKNCLRAFRQEKIQIVNKSNGYTASIFPFGQDQYQTDMIQLRQGENEILIRYVAPGGVNYEKTVKVSSTSI